MELLGRSLEAEEEEALRREAATSERRERTWPAEEASKPSSMSPRAAGWEEFRGEAREAVRPCSWARDDQEAWKFQVFRPLRG